MTPFAKRDERMMLGFAGVLLVFVVFVGVGVRSWRRRLVVSLVAAVAACLSFAGVFISLLAG